MKKKSWYLVVGAIFCLLNSNVVMAGAVQRFVGWYKLSNAKDTTEAEYLLVDNDTLEGIWKKYGDGPLPASLEPYKTESTILSGFTHRDFLMVLFEKFAVMNERYLKLEGNENELLELYRHDNGVFELATRQSGIIDRYWAAGPSATPAASLQMKLKGITQFQWFVPAE